MQTSGSMGQYCGLVLCSLLFSPAGVSSQVISWSKLIPGDTSEPLHDNGMALVEPEQVRCLTSTSPTELHWYDWQGTATNTETLDQGEHLFNTDQGNVLIGSFEQTMSLHGLNVEGGTADNDLFIAILDHQNELLHLEHSVSLGSQGIWQQRAAVSPNGRIAVLLSRASSMIWGTDTVHVESEERTLLAFDATGEFQWSKRLRGINYPGVVAQFGTGLAIDDDGRVWLSGSAFDNFLCGTDTVEIISPFAYDHFILRIAPDSELEASIAFPGTWALEGMMSCNGLQPDPDGGVIWIGSMGTTALIADSTITSTDRRGILIRLDQDLQVISFLTVNGTARTSLTAIARDPLTGGSILAGQGQADVEFGNSILSDPDPQNAFVTTMDTDGNVGPLLRIAGCSSSLDAYISLTTIMATAGSIHVLGAVGAGSRLWNGITVDSGRLLTRLDRENAVPVGPTPTITNGVLCWPSPVQYELHVRLVDIKGLTQYVIHNGLGAVVHRGVWSSNGELNEHVVPVSGWAPGVYSITTANATRRSVQRFVVGG